MEKRVIYTLLPVMEEEVIVEKRPVVKEEIVVTREVATETETVEADVRREQIDISGDEQLVDRDGMTRTQRAGGTVSRGYRDQRTH